ncbi:16S rRNA (cytosine(967)-C(5))-methyltransferase RsmB [Legionella waltersii]|uniref:16S rRNA (cytosine(967)-C(5))-methyltransferase n=1 Tax=Legionella waltersii TaxID=66969 RepID=A0A0W1ACX0_9GAMM|nr:16S rRNA (cytosine(967)-C(5))-methyltransferase RsmB [Legionella waltersii]KTD79181.1 rRNA methyltransferase [Legionella waltersii]SNV12397.1 Sun protein [Legionella waltersii]
MKVNERLQAVNILVELLEKKASLSHLFLTFNATPAAKEMCYGVCRHFFRLQAIADTLMKKRPKDLDVCLVVYIGLYQLHYLKKPEYAAVKETVDLLRPIKKEWAKGLVNAVLRNFCRNTAELLRQLANEPNYLFGHPLWLSKRMQKDWPEQWPDIAKANNEHPPMTLRVNHQKNSVENYLKQLKSAGIEAIKHPIAEDAVNLLSPMDVTQLPGFVDGAVSVQDAAAQLAVNLLSLQPDQKVLDACCAPGGKTCHILEYEPSLNRCIALDIEEKRLDKVHENLQRLGLQADVRVGNATRPETWWDGQLFDRILLDAPCSAIGVIRRHPDIKLLRTPEEVEVVTQLQRDMLESLWPLLVPGGLMVYATCSILKEENEDQMKWFVAKHPNCQVEPIHCSWGRNTGYGVQILPGDYGMDGFFYCVLRKI